MHLTTPLFSILALGAACSAQAAFVATLSQVGNDVVLTGSGTLNITGLTQSAGVFNGSQIASGYGLFLNGSGTHVDYVGYTSDDMNAPDFFGGRFDEYQGLGTGDYFGAQGQLFGVLILVPVDYVSGSFLSGTTIFANTTLEDLDVSLGEYVWTWGQDGNEDSLTLNIVVPEPAHYAIGAGIAALALVALRRRVK